MSENVIYQWKCPECEEHVRLTMKGWRHLDGEPLCVIVGSEGYVHAQPEWCGERWALRVILRDIDGHVISDDTTYHNPGADFDRAEDSYLRPETDLGRLDDRCISGNGSTLTFIVRNACRRYGHLWDRVSVVEEKGTVVATDLCQRSDCQMKRTTEYTSDGAQRSSYGDGTRSYSPPKVQNFRYPRGWQR